MVYFVFSDENGNYKKNSGSSFVKTTPRYIRSSFIVNAEDWYILNKTLKKAKDNIDIDNTKEVKWSYLWSIQKLRRDGKEIKESDPLYFLRKVKTDKLLNYYEEVLTCFSKCEFCKIIYTITDNNITKDHDEERLLGFHIEDHMQRIQMEIQNDKKNIAVFFIDPVSKETDSALSDKYHELVHCGNYIKTYDNIKDCLSIEYSHNSTGIQYADYLAGVCSGVLNGYDKSKEWYFKYIHKYVRENGNNKFGYGIMEVPTLKSYRNRLKVIFSENTVSD